MLSNKVLIFAPYPYHINSGGPSGFIAHNLVDKPKDYFDLSEDIFQATHSKRSLAIRLHQLIQKSIYKIQGEKTAYLQKRYFETINAHQYRFLYFHDVLSLANFKNFISPQQIIILQAHAPELPSDEYKNHAPDDMETYLQIKQAEEIAFQRADIVVFPHEGCIPIYEKILRPNCKIHFILSGAKNRYAKEQASTTTTEQQINKAIKKDKINLMYIGRRNYIKGFDIVLDSFRRIKSERDDLNLILVGKGDKIEEDNIQDIGFSSEPLSWYQNVDYLINANRQSYFDLSIIEALSTGVPILMSDNYGHAYYRNRSPLIQTFDATNPDGLYHLLAGNLTKRDYSNSANIQLYEAELSDVLYYQRFQEFIRSLPDIKTTL